MLQFLFPITLALSACLLFIIQPMVAKVLLPVYGGTPAVWTVCMLFFQGLLLIAYAYAWLLSRFKGRRNWRILHLSICFLSISALPLAFISRSSNGAPELQILENLLLQLGLPLLVIAASAPLLQYAYSQTNSKQAADPYFLYVASNGGSLLALLSYPFLLERFSDIKQQFYGWNIVYLAYLICLFCLLCSVRYTAPMPTQLDAITTRLAWRTKARWVFLSFIPCSLMLGVTFYISTDVAATPLFWVLPLALYLLSFMLCFAKKQLLSQVWVQRNSLVFLVFPILGFILSANHIEALQLIIVNLLGFFMLALLCLGELVNSRPATQQLTSFYLCLSLGGVLAGIFNGILAPRLFSHAYEYPLVLLLALTCIPYSRKDKPREWLIPVLVLCLLTVNFIFTSNNCFPWLQQYKLVEILALVLIVVCSNTSRSLCLAMSILFVFIFLPWFKPEQILSQQRNFYGIKQVFSQAKAHVLMSQSTIHGFQLESEEGPYNGARAYYGPVLPVVQQLQALYQPVHALVIGLGTGNMACQFRPQDELSIVEIDEQVINIATNPNLFSYLRDCPPQTTLIKNDGLLAAKGAQDAAYELLMVDAFNSDAIPIHLLTLEAFTLYKQKISQDGVILVNISNRHLRLLPVLTAVGRTLDMIVLHKLSANNNRLGQFASEWALLTSNESLAAHLMGKPGWRFVADNDTRLWTNNYSNIVPLLFK